MITKCQNCGKEFSFYADKIHSGKYCSRACYYSGRWGNRTITKACAYCGKSFDVSLSKTGKKFCSKPCYSSDQKRRTGLLANSFQGPIAYGRNGKYLARLAVGHPGADSKGYVMEHRLVMESAIGRYLRRDEVVHHKDENPRNNHINNLELLEKVKHDALHSRERWTRKKAAKLLAEAF